MTQLRHFLKKSKFTKTVTCIQIASLLSTILMVLECSISEDDCSVCLQEKCSDLIEICETDSGCACMVDCIGKSGIPGVDTCLETCDLKEKPANFAQVEECTAVACPDSEDECSTPSDWTPHQDTITCDGTGAGNIGGGTLADCNFEPEMKFDPEGAVLQLQSADKSVCARIERRDDGAGSLANTNWTLLNLRVGLLEEVALIDGATDLCWYSSHHNFRDWIHAWTGRQHFDLVLKEVGHGGDRIYELYVYEQGPIDPNSCAPTANGSTCIDGPIELFPVNP